MPSCIPPALQLYSSVKSVHLFLSIHVATTLVQPTISSHLGITGSLLVSPPIHLWARLLFLLIAQRILLLFCLKTSTGSLGPWNKHGWAFMIWLQHLHSWALTCKIMWTSFSSSNAFHLPVFAYSSRFLQQSSTVFLIHLDYSYHLVFNFGVVWWGQYFWPLDTILGALSMCSQSPMRTLMALSTEVQMFIYCLFPSPNARLIKDP